MRFHASFTVLCSFALLPACVVSPRNSDAGASTNNPDASATDSGASNVSDSGNPLVDAGQPDSGSVVDSGTPADGGGCRTVIPGSVNTRSPTCKSCVEMSCSSNVTSAETDCSAYSQCICTCGFMSSCQTTCESSITSQCQTDTQGLATCAAASCATECATPDGGFPFGDGGFPSFDGGGRMHDGGRPPPGDGG